MIKWHGTLFRVHPLFVLVMAASIATGYFIELIVLFGIVFVHEMGHVVAAKGFGWRVREVQLLPFGGVAVMDENGNVPVSEEIAVALSGPLQHVFMIGFALLMQKTGIWNEMWGDYFIKANVMIALFNLLPVLPLDGGKILQALLSLSLPYHRTLWVCSLFSLFMSVVMLLFSLLQVTTLGIHLHFMIIALFLFYTNWYGYRSLPFIFIRFLMSRDSRTRLKMNQGTLSQPIVVFGHLPLSQIVRLFMREKVHIIYVVDEKGIIEAAVAEQRLLQIYFKENKPGSAVSELFM